MSDVGYPVTGQLGWNAQTGYGDAVGNQCLPDWIVRPAPTTVNTDGSMNSVGFFDNDNAFNVERTPAPLCYVDPVECDPLLSATGPSTVQNTGWAELNHPQAMNALESVDTTSARGWPQNTGLANPREEEDFFNYLDMLPASEDFFSQSQTSNGDFTSSSNDAGFNHAAFPSEQNSNQESSFTSSSLDVHPSFLSFADTNGALHGIPMPDSRDPTLPSDFFQFPSDTEYFNNDMAFQLDPHSVADSQQDGDTTTVATSDVQAEPELYGGLTEQELLDALTAGCS